MSAALVESEADFRRWVTDLATALGWVWCYWPDSRAVQGQPGVPDLLLVRPSVLPFGRGRLLYVELKTTRGRLRPEQGLWLKVLASTHAETYVWRPADRAQIEATLR